MWMMCLALASVAKMARVASHVPWSGLGMETAWAQAKQEGADMWICADDVCSPYVLLVRGEVPDECSRRTSNCSGCPGSGQEVVACNKV